MSACIIAVGTKVKSKIAVGPIVVYSLKVINLLWTIRVDESTQSSLKDNVWAASKTTIALFTLRFYTGLIVVGLVVGAEWLSMMSNDLSA